jgi:hypothetical protein
MFDRDGGDLKSRAAYLGADGEHGMFDLPTIRLAIFAV